MYADRMYIIAQKQIQEVYKSYMRYEKITHSEYMQWESCMMIMIMMMMVYDGI